MNRSFLHRHAFALSAVCLTLVLRLLTLAQLSSSPYALPVTSDMKFYADWALRIARGEWSDGHAFYGQPLYAYLVGGIFAVVGYQPFWIGLLQALCDTAIALLIFKIATLVFAELPARRAALIGLLAAVGWAFYVPAAAYSGLLIPTSFVVAIWAFALWWILQRSATARWAECFGIAALVGLSALIAAATLVILPLLAVALFLKRRQLLFIALLAGLLAGTAPAWTHNLLVAHDPVFISAHGGLNFWIGNNPDANGYPKIPPGLPSDQAQLLESSIRIAETAAGHSLPRSEVSAFWSHKASAYIQANPGAWLGLVGVKLRNFWNAFRYDDLSSITPLRDAGIVLPGLHFGLLAALGLPGALFAFRNRRARWIIAALGLQMLALLPAFVNERYRLPAVPGLLILASFFSSNSGSACVFFTGRNSPPRARPSSLRQFSFPFRRLIPRSVPSMILKPVAAS